MNIFAKELDTILRRHKKDISSLYGLRVPDSRLGVSRPITPSKVSRLKRSLDHDITATLNSEELEALQDWAPLDSAGQELRHLRAALVAEGVRHLLAGRINAAQATHIGQLTLQSLLDTQTGSAELWREEVLHTVRADDDDDDDDLEDDLMSEASDESATATALDEIAGIYELGALWLGIAILTTDPLARVGLLALAAALLTRAREALRQTPAHLPGDPAWEELMAAIDAALARIDGL